MCVAEQENKCLRSVSTPVHYQIAQKTKLFLAKQATTMLKNIQRAREHTVHTHIISFVFVCCCSGSNSNSSGWLCGGKAAAAAAVDMPLPPPPSPKHFFPFRFRCALCAHCGTWMVMAMTNSYRFCFWKITTLSHIDKKRRNQCRWLRIFLKITSNSFRFAHLPHKSSFDTMTRNRFLGGNLIFSLIFHLIHWFWFAVRVQTCNRFMLMRSLHRLHAHAARPLHGMVWHQPNQRNQQQIQ